MRRRDGVDPRLMTMNGPDQHGIVRLPSLLHGELVEPEEWSYGDLLGALGDRNYAEAGGVQIIRQTVTGAGLEGGDLIFVTPRIADPEVLTVRDRERFAREVFDISTSDVADLLDRTGRFLAPGGDLFDGMYAVERAVGESPAAYLDAALAGINLAFDGATMTRAIDRELAFGAEPGSHFLDGWVGLEAKGIPPAPGVAARLAGDVHGSVLPRRSDGRIRAIPTRQLHVTAGNAPLVPIVSAVRGLSVKGAMTLKVPSGALAAGSALAVALHRAGPDHPLVRHASITYWRGGDERIEQTLFDSNAFDRIVVWGAPGSVDSVRSRAGSTKTLTFNPRYGLSMIGGDALTAEHFEETVVRAVTDSLVWNQRACIASLVHYVETDAETAGRFAEAVAAELALWDECHPGPMGAGGLAAVRLARRGGMRAGTWHTNGDTRRPSSAAVLLESEFDLSTHPYSRVVAVRPVERLEDVLPTLHHGVSQIGIAPEERRAELREVICAHGVTGVLPLGEADAVEAAGIPQDGMRPLTELVSWVTG